MFQLQNHTGYHKQLFSVNIDLFGLQMFKTRGFNFYDATGLFD